MEIINIKTVEQFNQLIQNTDKNLIVDFWATWCPPCKVMNPILTQLAEEEKTITVVKVDVDENPQLAQAYNIASIPTILQFEPKNSTPINNRIVGAIPLRELKELIK
jgi:thioredoxin 1